MTWTGNSIYPDSKKAAEDKSVWWTLKEIVTNLLNQQIVGRRTS